MPADPVLTERVRKLMKRRKGVREQKMFGGVAFMINGNMACGVARDDLCLRLGREGSDEALKVRGVRPMNFTGKVIKTMVFVSADVLGKDEDLKAWVDKGVKFARTLEPKE